MRLHHVFKSKTGMNGHANGIHSGTHIYAYSWTSTTLCCSVSFFQVCEYSTCVLTSRACAKKTQEYVHRLCSVFAYVQVLGWTSLSIKHLCMIYLSVGILQLLRGALRMSVCHIQACRVLACLVALACMQHGHVCIENIRGCL
jgi:hypothetical protein